LDSAALGRGGSSVSEQLVVHLVLFASRVSFFFGGAFFSAVFFDHLPELEVLPPLGQIIIKALYLAVVLFGLFCYSLELKRLGNAITNPPDKRGRSTALQRPNTL
jgi:hypothetical protein